MKVYVPSTTHLSRAMTRVEEALVAHSQERVQITRLLSSADAAIVHVVGYPDTVAAVAALKAAGQQYIMAQYCLRSTQRRSCADWLPLWKDALAVWSYYDLPELAREDGVDVSAVNFYHSPLGVDANVFRHRPTAPMYTILTSGYVAETECAQEAVSAAERVGGRAFHLGPNLGLRGPVTYKLGIGDAELARTYAGCQFVSGLRRCEGFELPAAEGLLCGARPILFDRSHYRRWFEPWGEFVPELSPASVEEHLAMIFARGPRPVDDSEITAARELFDWKRIIDGLWERVL